MNAKEKIINALIELLSIKDFNLISVTELCKIAKIHRTTFYAYYDNLYEVLLDIKNIVMNNFYKDIPSHNEEIDLLSKFYLIPYLEAVKKNKFIFQAYFKNAEFLEAKENFLNIYNKYILPRAIKNGVKDLKDIQYITKFYMAGIISLIKDWLDSNCEESSEYIATIIEKIRFQNKL